MEYINLSSRQIKRLAKLQLGKNVFATEATEYFYVDQSNKKPEMKVFKYFDDDMGKDKLERLIRYDRNRIILNDAVNEFVLPEKIVKTDDINVGFTMPYIENTNLADFLQFKDVTNKTKLNYLKKIGEILNKLDSLRKYNLDFNKFALGDLHEGNFIIDNNGDIKVIDLDSAYFGLDNELPACGKYLFTNWNLEIDVLQNKYQYTGQYYDLVVPDKNTDIYCYYMMILNFLYKGDVCNLSLEEYYDYLYYLEKIGISKEFTEGCRRIYYNADNINPSDYVNSLERYVNKSNKMVYQKMV